ncbi:MAG: hypothetical protein JNL62_24960, partial [Bryobacterales bacterium]|nr:hypothetical protein [Bryobacterales bacterium]
EDLAELRLLRRDKDRYTIAFTLLLADDVRRIRVLAEKHARILADSILAHRAEIEQLLATYTTPGVAKGDIAFIVLGCFSLDWDGLAILKAKGLRTGESPHPDGKYVPWAEERIADQFRSYDRSSTTYRGRTAYLSFSDGTVHGIPGEHPAPQTPVFTRKDQSMVARLRAIGRRAIESWLSTHYHEVRKELAGIAPMRAGVPFEESFNQIWHPIFGRTNALLVEAGLFTDPYAPNRPWRGYTPAIFDGSILK